MNCQLHRQTDRQNGSGEKKGVQIPKIGMFADWFLGLISGSLSFILLLHSFAKIKTKPFISLKTTQCTVEENVNFSDMKYLNPSVS